MKHLLIALIALVATTAHAQIDFAKRYADNPKYTVSMVGQDELQAEGDIKVGIFEFKGDFKQLVIEAAAIQASKKKDGKKLIKDAEKYFTQNGYDLVLTVTENGFAATVYQKQLDAQLWITAWVMSDTPDFWTVSILKGANVLNFSEWGNFSKNDRIKAPDLPAGHFFTPGNVTVSGRIMDYTPACGIDSVFITTKDLALDEYIPITLSINTDGTFSGTFEILSPQMAMVEIDAGCEPIYLSPGEDLEVVFDSKLNVGSFGGSLAEVNTALRHAPQAPAVMPMFNPATTPQEQKNWVKERLAPWEKRLQTYIDSLPDGSLAARLLSARPAIEYGEAILEYLMRNKGYSVKEVGLEFYADALRGLLSLDTLQVTQTVTTLNRLAYSRLPLDKVRELAGTDEVPIIWQIAATPRIASYPDSDPNCLEVTDPYLIYRIKTHKPKEE